MIALSAKPTTIDPQTSLLLTDFQLSQHIFDRLVMPDEHGRYSSQILSEYRALNSHTWRFTLKPNVRFSNGKKLTTEDIIYSLSRMKVAAHKKILAMLNQNIRSYKAIDKQSIEIQTYVPNASLPRVLVYVPIVSAPISSSPSKSLMQTERHFGTGPYKLVSWLNNGDIHLQNNPYYHGQPPYLQKVRLTTIIDAKKRIQALKDKQVDLIEKIPPNQIQKFSQKEPVDIIYATPNHLVFIELDSHRDHPLFIQSHNEQRLQSNPLKKTKVRKAISHAIDRQDLITSILYGAGVATKQLSRPGLTSHSSTLAIEQWNPDSPQKLLEQAGYPKGFKLGLHYAENSLSMHDTKSVAENIADALSEAGISTQAIKVNTPRTFIDNMYDAQYTAIVSGYTAFGGLGEWLDLVIHSYQQSNSIGIFNSGRYSNPIVDQLIDSSRREFDAIKRLEMQVSAMEIAMRDKAIIPLYFQKTIWAIRNDLGITLWKNPHGLTLAQDIHAPP